MSGYNEEQIQTLEMMRGYLDSLSRQERERLLGAASEYLAFRERFESFASEHFAAVCAEKCFHTKKSMCCSREGIITYFADHFVNALLSDGKALDAASAALENPRGDDRCVYLAEGGCVWRLKPMVCEMFTCDFAEAAVFEESPDLRAELTALKLEGKRFTWPDRPVYFDRVEAMFLAKGFTSPLMYLHNSPGLLRVKANAKRGGCP